MPKRNPIDNDQEATARRCRTACERYNRRFGTSYGFPPFGVSDEFFVEVLEEALAADRPVPDDFDWYQHLPPDAVA